MIKAKRLRRFDGGVAKARILCNNMCRPRRALILKKRCAAMNEVRKTIINPQETAGEGMKVNGMTRGMLYGKDFSKAAALCAKIAVPMAVILAIAVAF